MSLGDERRSLKEIVADPIFARRALHVIEDAGRAVTPVQALESLYTATAALGVDHAVFVSFVRDEDSHESYRFMLAADPRWCLRYQASAWYGSDPWLLYAAVHTEPICASQIKATTRQQQEVQLLAEEHGMVSTCIAPAVSPAPLARLGMLALGSNRRGFFEGEGIGVMKVLARGLAMELHGWWVRRARNELIESCRLSEEDLSILELEWNGLGTKEIARALGVSTASIDSRWQRLNEKLGAPNRRTSARLAAKSGLI